MQGSLTANDQIIRCDFNVRRRYYMQSCGASSPLLSQGLSLTDEPGSISIWTVLLLSHSIRLNKSNSSSEREVSY